MCGSLVRTFQKRKVGIVRAVSQMAQGEVASARISSYPTQHTPVSMDLGDSEATETVAKPGSVSTPDVSLDDYEHLPYEDWGSSCTCGSQTAARLMEKYGVPEGDIVMCVYECGTGCNPCRYSHCRLEADGSALKICNPYAPSYFWDAHGKIYTCVRNDDEDGTYTFKEEGPYLSAQRERLRSL